MAGPPPLMRPTFDVPIPTSKAPPHRTPTSAGNLRRAKTLTRPERGVAPTPLINPQGSSVPSPAGVLPHSIAAYNAKAASGATSWDAWSIFAHIVTFWAPPFLLSSIGGLKDKPTRQAWREKIALCFIALVLGAAVGFGTIGLNKALCPENATVSESRFLSVNTSNAAGFVSVGGNMYNLSQYKPQDSNNFFTFANKTPGVDVTDFFRRTAAQFDLCKDFPYHATSGDPCTANAKCTYPPITDKAFLAQMGLGVTDKLAGYDWDYVAAQPAYIVLDGAVLDFTVYLKDNPKP